MSVIKNVLKWIIASIGVVVLLLYIFDYDYILKGIRVVYFTGHTTAFIDDAKYFDTNTIKAEQPEDWPKHKSYNAVEATPELKQINSKLGTIAYVIIKNDSIIQTQIYFR